MTTEARIRLGVLGLALMSANSVGPVDVAAQDPDLRERIDALRHRPDRRHLPRPPPPGQGPEDVHGLPVPHPGA